MKLTLPFAVLLLLSPPVFAADPAPQQCLEQDILIQQLRQQLAQAQYRLAPLDFEAAQKEQVRLQSLLPKKTDDNPKKASAAEKH